MVMALRTRKGSRDIAHMSVRMERKQKTCWDLDVGYVYIKVDF